MDASAATVIAGIGAAAISGAVAIISTHLASLKGSKDAAASRMERSEDREHALLVQLIPKQLTALETVWWASFLCEQTQSLTPDNQEQLLKASLWLPDSLRVSILEFVSRTGTKIRLDESTLTQLAEVRWQALELSRVHKIERFFNKREDHKQ